MKLCAIVLIVAGSFVQSLYAQDSTRVRHMINLRFGVNQLKDENLHGKASTGTITELQYGVEKVRDRWNQFYFSLGYSRPKNEFEDVSKSANLKLQLGYCITFNIVTKGNLQYYLGPEVALAYSVAYYPNWDDSHLYWANYLSAAVRNNLVVKLPQQKVWVTSLSLPVFSLHSRPELYRLYKIDDTSVGGIAKSLNSNLAASHLTNTFYAKLNTEIRFPAFRSKTQSFCYHFDYLRMKDNAGAAFYQIIHQVGITFFL